MTCHYYLFDLFQGMQKKKSKLPRTQWKFKDKVYNQLLMGTEYDTFFMKKNEMARLIDDSVTFIWNFKGIACAYMATAPYSQQYLY